MKTAVLWFLLVLAAVGAAAQSLPYIENYEVRIHGLDVVVTDRDGKPVSGLTKDDFIVLENGVAQTLTNFSAFASSAATATSAAGTAQSQAPDERPQARRFIFFVDEMALHPNSRTKFVKTVMQFAESSMHAADEAMVVAPAAETKIVQDFTTDRAAIRTALEKVMASMNSRTTQQFKEQFYLENQRGRATTDDEQRHIRQIYADSVRRRVLQRLGELRSLVAALAQVEGKKVLVLATTSLSAMPGLDAWAQRRQEMLDGQTTQTSEFDSGVSTGLTDSFAGAKDVYDLRPFIADLGRTAAANGVTIYSLQPDVQLENVTPGGVSTRQRGGSTTSTFHALLEMNELTMSSLAERTGGRWFRGDGNVDDAFQQVSKDLGTYYSLGYRAGEDDDRIRKVEVRVKNRPELRVRTRSEVVNKTNANEMQDLVVASLLYPRPVNELGVIATTGAMVTEPLKTILVPIDVRIPMDKLTFLPEGEKARAVFTIHYAAAGVASDFTSAQEKQQVLEIKTSELPQIAGKTWRFTTKLRFAPGKYRVAVGVLDRVSRLSGFQTLEVIAQ
ncbi:MAG TPA: VWA domain-containing protein [Thermoanaerobaculia bacterium]